MRVPIGMRGWFVLPPVIDDVTSGDVAGYAFIDRIGPRSHRARDLGQRGAVCWSRIGALEADNAPEGAMAEETFDPVRMLAELNALGVRYVLVGDLASEGPGSVLTSDRLEICVADDDEDIDRLRAMLVALDAEQDEPSDDPHRAVFRTPLGRLECLEMAADTQFAELERRAGHVDFGNRVIVRTAPRAHHMTSSGAVVEVHGPDGEPDEVADDRTPAPRRIWQKLEPKLERIDDLLSGSGRRPRLDPPDPGR